MVGCRGEPGGKKVGSDVCKVWGCRGGHVSGLQAGSMVSYVCELQEQRVPLDVGIPEPQMFVGCRKCMSMLFRGGRENSSVMFLGRRKIVLPEEEAAYPGGFEDEGLGCTSGEGPGGHLHVQNRGLLPEHQVILSYVLP